MAAGFLRTARFEEVILRGEALPLDRVECLIGGPPGAPLALVLSDHSELLDADEVACRLALRWRTIVPDLRPIAEHSANELSRIADAILAVESIPLIVGIGGGAAVATGAAAERGEQGQATILLLVEPGPDTYRLRAQHHAVCEVLTTSPLASRPAPGDEAIVGRQVLVPGVEPGHVAVGPAGIDAISASAERLARGAGISWPG